MNRVEFVNKLKELEVNITSNIKFLTLLYSRLLEEGIPKDAAIMITGATNFDFSNVPEDDDTLADIATEYATYCKKVYAKIVLHGYEKGDKIQMFRSLFGQVRLEVEH